MPVYYIMKHGERTIGNRYYRELWKKAIKKIILNLKIIKIMKIQKENEETLDLHVFENSFVSRTQIILNLPFGLLRPDGLFNEI